MTGKLSGLALIILVFCLVLVTCYVENDPLGSGTAESYGSITGEATGTAPGFYGTPVTVTLKMIDGIIVEAIVDGPNETTGIGTRAVNAAPKIIVAKNSPDIDKISGATRTSDAIRMAGFAALERLLGASGSDVKMIPGVYGVRANGFGGSFDVLVSISERSIIRIETDNDKESIQVGKPAIPIMIDRIITAQNSEADAVASATITSTALKLAVREVLAKAGAPLSMTTKPSVDEFEKYDRLPKTVDVLVIGSGAAGMSAAIEAASYGVSVAIIEKEYFLGGSTKFSGGVIYAAADASDKNILRDYFYFRAQEYADIDLLGTYSDKSIELVDETWKVKGFPVIPSAALSTTPFASGMSSVARARTVTGGGIGLMKILEEKARDYGITILTGVKATKLEKNSSGAVVRVRAESSDSKFIFEVSKGVILATGGFDNDTDGFLTQYNSDSKYFPSLSSHGNIGEGIKMGMEMGAATVFKGGRIGWTIIDPTFDYYIESGFDRILSISGNLALNLDLTAPVAGMAADGAPLAAVNWDDDTHNPAGPYQQNAGDDLGAMFTGALKATTSTRFFQISNSPIPSKGRITQSYLESLHLAFNHNSISELNEDAFHSAVTASILLDRYSERGWGSGPYCALFVRPSSIGSMGGLKIDSNGRVLGSGQMGTVSGEPIPGLYAAGEVANGDFYYQQYPAAGSSLALSLVFGRLAGQHAAQR